MKTVTLIISNEYSESPFFWMVTLLLVSFVSSYVLVAKEYNALIRNYTANYSGKDLVFTNITYKRTLRKNRKQLKIKNNPLFLKFLKVCFMTLTVLFLKNCRTES